MFQTEALLLDIYDFLDDEQSNDEFNESVLNPTDDLLLNLLIDSLLSVSLTLMML